MTPEPGGTPGTPVTEAGRRLIRNLTRQVKPVVMGLVLDDILAIEAEATRAARETWDLAAIDAETLVRAEAARSERERIVAAVEGLEERNDEESVAEGYSQVDRSEVLALIDPDRRP